MEISPSWPTEWKTVKLGQMIKEIKDKNKSNIGFPVFTISHVNGLIPSHDYFYKKVYSQNLSNYKVITRDCFAYNPYRADIGSIALFDNEVGLVSPAYTVFKITETDHLHPGFLYKVIKSTFYMSEIKRMAMSRGSIRKNFSFKDLSEFIIPLPPLSEQNQIDHILNSIQETKEKSEALILSSQKIKKSFMKYLFAYGPVCREESKNLPLKETQIGLLPEEWQVVRLGEIGNFRYGCTACGETQVAGPKFLRITDLAGDNKINWDKVPFCFISGQKYNQFSLKNDDLLIARIGSTTGKACLIKNPPGSVFASYLIRLSIRDRARVYPDFLYHLTKSDLYLFQINTNKEGKLKKGISATLLQRLKIPLPPFPTQKKIAEILSAIDQKIEAHENQKRCLEALFKTMFNHFMNGKIRVNIS